MEGGNVLIALHDPLEHLNTCKGLFSQIAQGMDKTSASFPQIVKKGKE